MGSQASTKFAQSSEDILMLWHVHAEVSGRGKGRKRRADVLNRAAVVFISACWESYVEDAAREAFGYLLRYSTTPDVFPSKVKTLASRELRESKDERKVWELAGDGWKTVLADHSDVVLENWLKNFNTPKSKQVSKLFAELLDLRDVTTSWTWPAMSAEQACTKLDEYVLIRGNIAHRTKHNEVVYKSAGKDFRSHVVRLVEKTDEALGIHLQRLTNTSPWQEV